MKDLISYLVKNITGNEDFEVDEKNEDSLIVFTIRAKPEYMGLIIGKEGKK